MKGAGKPETSSVGGLQNPSTALRSVPESRRFEVCVDYKLPSTASRRVPEKSEA